MRLKDNKIVNLIKKHKWLGGCGAILLIIVVLLTLSRFKSRELDYSKLDLDEITVGKVEKVVTANGTINPVNLITVGSQVSGIIEKLYVDYNDEVKKDQILAKLETDILEKSLAEQESMLRQAKSKLDLVKINTNRTRQLYQKKFIAQIELDEAETELINATEEYNIAKASYYKAKKNLSYAYITSPTNGVIISRAVDEGQTVAASFQAPELFSIAEDLRKMQIETSVSEADIGMIKTGKEIKFTVDAYRREFVGRIKQIRLNPTTDQNVVVYNVIIEIDNEENLLLPGMTAYVSIVINSVDNVFRVQNTTLRFRPDEARRKFMNIQDNIDRSKLQSNQLVVYRFNDNKKIKTIEPIVVERGLSDAKFTEIKSDLLKEGDKIISAYLVASDGKK